MKLDEVGQIKEVNNLEEVNKALAQGYILIKIFNQREETQDGISTKVAYVLGLPRKE